MIVGAQGDFNNVWSSNGSNPDEVVYIEPGNGAYSSGFNFVDVGILDGVHFISSDGGPLAVKEEFDGEISGTYFVHPDWDPDDGANFEVFVVGAASKKSPRRPSLILTEKDEAILRLIAQIVGAKFKGRGSWRVMLRKILRGELKVVPGFAATPPLQQRPGGIIPEDDGPQSAWYEHFPNEPITGEEIPEAIVRNYPKCATGIK